ncbi:MAG: hypothetical protein Q3972_02190 [Corynebacterium sp.]|nr:hypothetical protein [Corynebacterium sp.]
MKFKNLCASLLAATTLGGALVSAGAPAAHAYTQSGPSVCKFNLTADQDKELNKVADEYLDALTAWDKDNTSRGGATSAPVLAALGYALLYKMMSGNTYIESQDLQTSLKYPSELQTLDEMLDKNSDYIIANRDRANNQKVSAYAMAAAASKYATITPDGPTPTNAQVKARINAVDAGLVHKWVTLTLAFMRPLGKTVTDCAQYYGYSEEDTKKIVGSYMNQYNVGDGFYWNYTKKEGFTVGYIDENLGQQFGAAMGSITSMYMPFVLSSLPFALSSGSSSK